MLSYRQLHAYVCVKHEGQLRAVDKLPMGAGGESGGAAHVVWSTVHSGSVHALIHTAEHRRPSQGPSPVRSTRLVVHFGDPYPYPYSYPYPPPARL